MFATKTDQENLTYEHQRVAAAKPLNQSLDAKTPRNKAPKTPFRKQLNDENDAFNTGFKTGKKDGDLLFTKGNKGAELDRNAFVTPAGPRNRAPLGMKTTNAKGTLLKTPAPVKETAQKTISPRLRRPKVKIHHEASQEVEQVLAEAEIEYMPPRSIPLPEYPDDHENWDMLKGGNLTNGWYGVHMNPVGKDGLTRMEREMKNIRENADRKNGEAIRKALENDPICGLDINNLSKYFDEHSVKPAALKKRDPLERPPSTMSSKSAASALSRPTSASSTVSSAPRFAAPTANTNARTRVAAPALAPVSRKMASSATAPTAASMRHAAATAVSRSTLGYSKGRVVSASAKQPLSSIFDKSTKTASANPVEHSSAFIRQKQLLESLITDDPELEQLFVEKNGDGDSGAEELAGGLEGINFNDNDDEEEEEEELKDFELSMPEE